MELHNTLLKLTVANNHPYTDWQTVMPWTVCAHVVVSCLCANRPQGFHSLFLLQETNKSRWLLYWMMANSESSVEMLWNKSKLITKLVASSVCAGKKAGEIIRQTIGTDLQIIQKTVSDFSCVTIVNFLYNTWHFDGNGPVLLYLFHR